MKILLIATVQSHICQFHHPLVDMLHQHGYEVHVAARDNLAEKNGLKLDFVDKVFDVPFQRSPFSLKNLAAYRMLKEIIDSGKYDAVHCNTPVGGVIGRLAARDARKHATKVIYTAHGFHFYQGAPLKNWLIWYPIEQWMAHYCDTLVTITKEDYALSSRKFHTDVRHIHGIGVSPERFYPVDVSTRQAMRSAEGLADSDFVILCVGELNKNKNQKMLLQATALLKDRLPALRILLAGNGPQESELRVEVEQLGIQKLIRFLGYRTDLEKITPAVDMVVSCSRREGLPLNILEAMLCAKPVVASINRGHRELVRDGENGYLLSQGTPEELSRRILELHNAPEMRIQLGSAGSRLVEAYKAQVVVDELQRILNTKPPA